MLFVATTRVGQQIFCFCCFWIRDPRSGMNKNQDPGYTSRVRNNAIKRRNVRPPVVGLWPRPPVERTRPLIPLRGGEATLPHSLRPFNTRLLKTGQNDRTAYFYNSGEKRLHFNKGTCRLLYPLRTRYSSGIYLSSLKPI